MQNHVTNILQTKPFKPQWEVFVLVRDRRMKRQTDSFVSITLIKATQFNDFEEAVMINSRQTGAADWWQPSWRQWKIAVLKRDHSLSPNPSHPQGRERSNKSYTPKCCRLTAAAKLSTKKCSSLLITWWDFKLRCTLNDFSFHTSVNNYPCLFGLSKHTLDPLIYGRWGKTFRNLETGNTQTRVNMQVNFKERSEGVHRLVDPLSEKPVSGTI